MGLGIMRALATMGVVGIISVGGAAAAHANWGQEVKDCNQTSCYPGGESRGAYVRGQATDSQGPGYAWEIHNLAFPGKSDPTLP